MRSLISYSALYKLAAAIADGPQISEYPPGSSHAEVDGIEATSLLDGSLGLLCLPSSLTQERKACLSTLTREIKLAYTALTFWQVT